MTFAITLVASGNPLLPQHVAAVTNYIDSNGLQLSGVPVWLAREKAVDIFVAKSPQRSHVENLWAILNDERVDLFITPAQGRRKKLLLADMDSTIVTCETLDEIAVHAGIGEKIAAITAAAMRGELDFKEALRARVKMLEGQPEKLLTTVFDEMKLVDGATALTGTMTKSGAQCVLVSGGFTFFTAGIAKQAGFHHHHGNVLQAQNGTLTGTVGEPILDKDAKLAFLHHYAQQLKIGISETIAIGDGANDLPMLQAAGLGIGYRPKPLLRQSLDNCILYGDLQCALFAQGYHGKDIINGSAKV